MHICNAQDEAKCVSVQKQTKVSHNWVNYAREVNTQEVSLKQQSVEIIREHSP